MIPGTKSFFFSPRLFEVTVRREGKKKIVDATKPSPVSKFPSDKSLSYRSPSPLNLPLLIFFSLSSSTEMEWKKFAID